MSVTFDIDLFTPSTFCDFLRAKFMTQPTHCIHVCQENKEKYQWRRVESCVWQRGLGPDTSFFHPWVDTLAAAQCVLCLRWRLCVHRNLLGNITWCMLRLWNSWTVIDSRDRVGVPGPARRQNPKINAPGAHARRRLLHGTAAPGGGVKMTQSSKFSGVVR